MTVTNPYAACTAKQLAYLNSLARGAGYRGVDDARRAYHGKSKCSALKRGEASALIDWLLGDDDDD